MQLKNTENNFGLISIMFHWTMAIIIIGLLAVGLFMKHFALDSQKNLLYGLHKEFGILILILVVFRLIWKLVNTSPHLSLSKFELIASRVVQFAFYGFMIAMPFSGWLISSAANKTVSFFGLFTMPSLISSDKILLPVFLFIHKWFAYILIANIILHISAALKHHYINKDKILRRIVTWK
ncbi:MAG: cytochrome b [Legionellaceae bacterium]|nr:cytochrome b [Legionellaceae bacterium]